MKRFVLGAQMMIRAFRKQQEAERYRRVSLGLGRFPLLGGRAGAARDHEMRRLRREYLEPFEA
jgi:hypothetical protein